MALHGKNGFEVVKINIRALPIIFRKWRPCAVVLFVTARRRQWGTPFLWLRAVSVRGLNSRLAPLAAPRYCLLHATNANGGVCYSMASLAMHWRASDTGRSSLPGLSVSQSGAELPNVRIKVGREFNRTTPSGTAAVPERVPHRAGIGPA